jgi:hypothetical protein
MKKRRRSAHAEGEDDSEDYIASEGVKLQRGACRLRVGLI